MHKLEEMIIEIKTLPANILFTIILIYATIEKDFSPVKMF